jgi:hypothetical protein
VCLTKSVYFVCFFCLIFLPACGAYFAAGNPPLEDASTSQDANSSNGSCTGNTDCEKAGYPGHACVSENESPSSESTNGSTLADAAQEIDEYVVNGHCSEECDQKLCTAYNARSECTSRYGDCEPVECGKVVKCFESSSPLYCDVEHNTCHRTNGQCGRVGSEDFDCPLPSEWHGPDTEIHCNESTGFCVFEVKLPKTPKFNEVPQNLRLTSPKYGQTFAPGEDIEFRISGSDDAAFVAVLETQPDTFADIYRKAIWMAALPTANAKGDVRSVRWLQGHEVDGSTGEWLVKPGELRTDVNLYAVAVTVKSGDVTNMSGELVLFRVGTPFPESGDACVVNDSQRGAAASAACEHPGTVQACINGRCRKLCLSKSDCSADQSCTLYQDKGVRYCN